VLVAVFLVSGFVILRVSTVTGNVAWAWSSVGVSVAAIAILALDWRRTVAAADDYETIERFAHSSFSPEAPSSESTPADGLPGSVESALRPVAAPNTSAGSEPPAIADMAFCTGADAAGSAGISEPEVAAGPATMEVDRAAPEPGDSSHPVDAGHEENGTVEGMDEPPAEIREGTAQPHGESQKPHPPSDQDEVGQSAAREHDADTARLFTPDREADEGAAETAGQPPAATPMPHGAAPIGLDATEVFERVSDHDGAGGDGVADAGVQECSQSGEERADERVSAAVARRDDEVLVVDEFPRYHLRECRWLDGRHTTTVAVREAVELGFTPCEMCTPARVEFQAAK